MPFPYFDETEELNDATRAAAGGSFVRLSDGVTHFELSGPTDGAAVILVHGFSVPYVIFDGTFEFLAESGFRVLRYDLFGRGFSDRPNLAYNMDLFLRQLGELVDALRLRELRLVGLSMGGPVSAAFAGQNPEVVRRVVLIDPCGARSITLSRLQDLARIPLLGEAAFGLFGSGNMVQGLASDLFDPRLVQHFVAQYRSQMKLKGFKRAILSSLRNNMLGAMPRAYERLGELGTPTLIVWGREDATVPFEHSELIRGWLPQAEFFAVDKCGHLPHFEKRGDVHPILKEFLQRE